MQAIVAQTVGTVMIVGHALTVDATVRTLSGLDAETSEDAVRTAPHYPYCVAIVMQQQADSGCWSLMHNALPPITCAHTSSRVNYRFLLRNSLL